METFVVRVWLPDRAGALGQVATRLGAVPAEIVGIDILERGGGRAIDELAVSLDPALVPTMVAALRGLDGVDVEEIHRVDGGVHDPRSASLDVAALLVGAGDRAGLLGGLVEHGRRLVGGAWAGVLSLHDAGVVVTDGPAPDAPWLVAFVEGARCSDVTPHRTSDRTHVPGELAADVVWAPLASTGLFLVVGRTSGGFRARERRQVAALARIADGRLRDLSRRAHPSVR